MIEVVGLHGITWTGAVFRVGHAVAVAERNLQAGRMTFPEQPQQFLEARFTYAECNTLH